MRHAPLSRKTEEVTPSRLKIRSSGLRISRPGDNFEREADRVAATVVSGRRVHAGMMGTSKAGGILRDPIPTGSQTDQQTAPQPNNYGDALSKVAEAFLKTQVGQQMVQHFTEDDPRVKEATNFVKTPGGLIAAGATATGVIATLAAAHHPLPAQLPAIPLDMLSSRLEGLKLQISYQGPVDHPTQAMVTLSYEGKSSEKKKKQSASDTYRAETAGMAADQDKFRAGLRPTSGLEADQQKKEAQWIQDASLRRAGTLQGSGHVWDLSQMGKNYPRYDLHMRGADSTAQSGGTSSQATSDKKEELPVQRSALSSQEVFAERVDVEAGTNSGGLPLDRETRRFMEDRIGFDFSKVRIHSGAEAASSAADLHARAYTLGNNIVFNEGGFAPHTTEGRRLLAHELTHVAQQSDARLATVPARSSLPAGNMGAKRFRDQTRRKDSR